NIEFPIYSQNREENLLKCKRTKTSFSLVQSETKKKQTKLLNKYSSNKTDYTNKNTSLHNGKMTLYEDPIEPNITSSLTSSDNLHSFDFYTSPPLILRSCTSIQSSNRHQQQKSNDKNNQTYLTDLSNKYSNSMRLSIDYIHRIVEQNEHRYEQQEHNRIITQEWQILGRVVDRLLVFIFLISTMVVFLFIFLQAPHLRLK
ncbi:unnamed protein product, partial [Rotaria sp. Silwood1]